MTPQRDDERKPETDDAAGSKPELEAELIKDLDVPGDASDVVLGGNSGTGRSHIADQQN
jgi:hypothetical protein